MIKPYLIDTTLRDGEQTPGVVFSLDEKIQICSLLDKIGIPEIEIGMPIVSANDADDIKSIVNSGFNFKTLAWCRAKFEDMKAAQKTGVDGAHLSFPVSDIQLNAIGKDKAWVLNQMKEVLTYANDNFSFVSLGAQDAPRANREFLYDYISSAISLGIKRIRIADTTGMMNPDSVKELFLWLSSLFPMFPFEFHAHNDLGMATANTVTALTSGAQSASVTVNGLGERAGNAALEEVCMAMEISYGVKMNLNYHYINEISQYTSKASKSDIAADKPIVGERAFLHESGIHTRSMIKDRRTYQILSAETIGRTESSFVFGKHSGAASLISFLNDRMIDIDLNQASIILKEIKKISIENKRALSEKELLNIYHKSVSN